MGVDFYACHHCGDTFCDAGYYFSCEGCGEFYCSNECGAKQTAEEPENYDDNPSWEDQTTCRYCRVEAVSSTDLLHFLLKKFGLTEDQATEMYKKEEADGKQGNLSS